MFKKIAVILLIGVGILAYVYRSQIKSLFSGNNFTNNKTEVKLILREDPTIEELAIVLDSLGVIKKEKFIKESRNQNLTDTSFDAGKYVILTQTRIPNLIASFVKSDNGHGKNEVKVNVQFNRCKTIADIGSNISKCIIADSASIVDYVLSDKTLNYYHFTPEQVPALFLPDNYEMYFDTDAEAFVAFMANEFKKFWNNERLEKLKKVGLKTPSEAVTVASIVYSEQGKVPDEWPIIAKLYLNRLNHGIPLQSDPTFKFCWGDKLDGVKRLLNKHRDIDCPYNTYKYGGLPPGPICITPASVIEAVLNPAQVDYIFMCAKPDYTGEHNFTASASQHGANARLYQNWLSKELN